MYDAEQWHAIADNSYQTTLGLQHRIGFRLTVYTLVFPPYYIDYSVTVPFNYLSHFSNGDQFILNVLERKPLPSALPHLEEFILVMHEA